MRCVVFTTNTSAHGLVALGIYLQVIKYESVIHEFDPYFNYRVTQVGFILSFDIGLPSSNLLLFICFYESFAHLPIWYLYF